MRAEPTSPITPTLAEDERVLVFAPYGREATLVRGLLEQEGLRCTVCDSAAEFHAALACGAGAALLTEEALSAATLERLTAFLSAQPTWSDLPLLLLVSRADIRAKPLAALRPLRERWSVTVLERPVRSATLFTLVHTMLRARRRQYQVRDLLAQLGQRLEQQTSALTRTTVQLSQETEERQAAEVQRRQSDTRFAKVFYASPLPIAVSTLAEGRFVDINDSALALLGFRRAEVVGHTERELGQWQHAPSGARPALLRRLAEGGSLRDLEIKVRTRTGDLRDALASYEAIEFGGEPCLLSLFVDITDRKRTGAQLKEAIEKTMQNAAWFSHQVMEELAQLKSGVVDTQGIIELTKREREVLARLAAGKSNGEIGAELGLAEQTVRNYITNIYGKLGVHSRAEAVVWARGRGMI